MKQCVQVVGKGIVAGGVKKMGMAEYAMFGGWRVISSSNWWYFDTHVGIVAAQVGVELLLNDFHISM